MAETTYPSFTPTYHHSPYPAILPTQPQLSCKGLNVIITGAGTGIGQAIALGFAEAHAKNIIVLGRTVSTLQETADKIDQSSNKQTKPITLTADITNAESVATAFADAKKQVGKLDILVNCAGGLLAIDTIEKIDLGGFWKTMELNVLGPMTVTQAFIKAAAESDSEPRTVINISSGSAHVPYAPQTVAYTSSKLAAAKVMEFVHYEHRDWRVFNVQPGVVATALSKGRKPEDDSRLVAGFAVWLARAERAVELNGRFLWANWDVNELLDMSKKIQQEDLLMLNLKGWAEDYTADDLMDRARKVHNNDKT